MDNKLITTLKKICSCEEPAALVTIIKVKGSTPRKPGAKMLVTLDGQVFGTIGGGCGEAEVRREALNALTSLKSVKYNVNMTNSLAEEEGMVCGGVMEVLIDILKPGINDDKILLNKYLESWERGQDPILVTLSNSELDSFLGKKVIITSSESFGNLEDEILQSIDYEEIKGIRKERKNKTISIAANEFFVEPAPVAVELLILGGGHIALPLAQMAKILGYKVTVVDDRPSFANRERFKEADWVICDDFVAAIGKLEINPNTFVVIVTRGHRHDRLCLQEIIKHPAGYIGMIGSRRRVRALIDDLIDEGISSEKLQNIYSPIGLDIGGETPEEVAVSIIAELVSVHRGGRSQSLKLAKKEMT